MAGVDHARKLHDAVILHLVQLLRTVCHTRADRGPPKKHLPWTLLDPAARRTNDELRVPGACEWDRTLGKLHRAGRL